MANFLPPEIVEKARRLRRDGAPLRKISRELGISINTVSRYLSAQDGMKCLCGDSAGHKGWCQVRYAESAARQAFHARRRGVFLSYEVSVSRSRVTESVKEKRIWVGDIKSPTFLLERREWLGAVGEVYNFTKKVNFEIRDDVRQEMILACLEGRLPQKDIKRAVITFVGFVLRGNCYFGAHRDFDVVSYDDRKKNLNLYGLEGRAA